jgi:hypothetical protein
MAWRGRGRGRPGGWARHDITLKEDEELSDVPQTYPPARMPAKAPSEGSLDAETKRLLVSDQCTGDACTTKTAFRPRLDTVNHHLFLANFLAASVL